MKGKKLALRGRSVQGWEQKQPEKAPFAGGKGPNRSADAQECIFSKQLTSFASDRKSS